MPTPPIAEHRIPVSLRSLDEARAAQRIRAIMPVHVEGQMVETRDLSATGLSFNSAKAYSVGDVIRVTIEYLLDGACYPLESDVEVMRVESGPGGFVIGARIVQPGMEAGR